MVSFDPAKLAGIPLEIEVIKPKDARTVHAKFYWLEGPDGCAAVMGSANCSSAAWLIPPEEGGNVEAIAVYDNPSKNDFGRLFARFDPNETPASFAITGTSVVSRTGTNGQPDHKH